MPKSSSSPTRVLSLTAILIVWAAPIQAVDGVLEINHSAIMASGGYPWAPGSGNYRLTSDLRPGPSLGIDLQEDHIVIDFNGFALIGDGSTFDGVSGGPSPDGHVIKNGSIRGLGGKAISAVSTCRIQDMQITSNAGGGLEIGPRCIVKDSLISFNGGVGGLAGQGSGVLYKDSVFFSNSGGDVSGATSVGENVCDEEPCAAPRMRRFYLTDTPVAGNAPRDAGTCAERFHFASLWEIWDPSNLRYDTSLGHSKGDSGQGPPTLEYGWIRTGGGTISVSLGFPGVDNCWNWTNGSNLQGSQVRLTRDWELDPMQPLLGPWEARVEACSSEARVWCVED